MLKVVPLAICLALVSCGADESTSSEQNTDHNSQMEAGRNVSDGGAHMDENWNDGDTFAEANVVSSSDAPADAPGAAEDVADRRGDGAQGCTCSAGQLPLDCFCNKRPCPPNFDSARTNVTQSCPRPNGFPTQVYLDQIKWYAGCGLVEVAFAAIDGPMETWTYDIGTGALVGISYSPGLRDQYVNDLCANVVTLGVMLRAGMESAAACVVSRTENVCDHDAAADANAVE